MQLGVFIPIGNNGWLISTTSPQYKPSFDLNRKVVEKAEAFGFDFALSMIKLHGFGGPSGFWDYNLESFTLMAGLAAVTTRIQFFATCAVLTVPPPFAARMAVTIDSISHGRFGVNIISGWQRREYTQMGIWPGDSIMDIVGPLGKPSEIAMYGTVVTIGGGVGTAMAYPTAAAMKRAGNRVISILGGRNKDLVILEDEMRGVSDTVFVTTDDGSYADKGLVTDKLRQLIENGTRIDLVLAVGPIPMMRAVAEMTRKEHIRTMVSLNPIMIDGTGMCGGCRVLVEGKSEFACVDGPEFDAHRVDFAVLVQRNAMYRDAEKRSMDAYRLEIEAKKAEVSEAPTETAMAGCALEAK